MQATGWPKRLEVTADGTGIVSHAGLALLRALADRTGLTGGLSEALASDRLVVHDRGRVMADLACTIADGAEVISDLAAAARPRRPARQGRAQDPALPHPARHRPAGAQRPPSAAQDLRHLALGTAITAAWDQITALPQASRPAANHPRCHGRSQTQRARGTPATRPTSRAAVIPGL